MLQVEDAYVIIKNRGNNEFVVHIYTGGYEASYKNNDIIVKGNVVYDGDYLHIKGDQVRYTFNWDEEYYPLDDTTYTEASYEIRTGFAFTKKNTFPWFCGKVKYKEAGGWCEYTKRHEFEKSIPSAQILNELFIKEYVEFD